MQQAHLNIAVNIVNLLILSLILIGLAFDPDKHMNQKHHLSRFCKVMAIMLAFDILAWLLEGNSEHTVLPLVVNLIVEVLSLSIYILLLWLTNSFVQPETRLRKRVCIALTVLICLEIAATVFSIPFGWFFHIKEGLFSVSIFYSLLYIIPALCVIFSTLSAFFTEKLSQYEKLSFAALVVFFLIGFTIQILYPNSSIGYAFATFYVLAVYIGIYMRRSKQLADAEAELNKKRVSMMISQMQPHFLFNSLTSIVDLCDRDPQQAKRAIIDFSNYLRGNLDAMTSETLIPFQKELEHCKTYLGFEKLRFEKQLEVIYDIACTDFTLPALSVQPLLENAVKHGVGHKDGGGMVVLAVRRNHGYVTIKIMDDGIGFDPTSPLSKDSSHVGIENVRSRLAMMCNGTLRISSTPGMGSTAEIRIPEEAAP